MRRAAAALAAALSSGCFAWPATVDLSYAPLRAQPIDAAGVHELRFCVRVRDRREIGDPRNVGQRAGTPLGAPTVRSTRDAADVVRDALVAELRSHDLRVAPIERCDALIEVELTALYALASGQRRGPLQGGEIEGHVAGELRVLDRRGGAAYLDLAVAGREAVDSMLLTARKYEWALNAALADFAQRAVRHPDFLIAVQEVWRIAKLRELPPD